MNNKDKSRRAKRQNRFPKISPTEQTNRLPQLSPWTEGRKIQRNSTKAQGTVIFLRNNPSSSFHSRRGERHFPSLPPSFSLPPLSFNSWRAKLLQFLKLARFPSHPIGTRSSSPSSSCSWPCWQPTSLRVLASRPSREIYSNSNSSTTSRPWRNERARVERKRRAVKGRAAVPENLEGPLRSRVAAVVVVFGSRVGLLASGV